MATIQKQVREFSNVLTELRALASTQPGGEYTVWRDTRLDTHLIARAMCLVRPGRASPRDLELYSALASRPVAGFTSLEELPEGLRFITGLAIGDPETPRARVTLSQIRPSDRPTRRPVQYVNQVQATVTHPDGEELPVADLQQMRIIYPHGRARELGEPLTDAARAGALVACAVASLLVNPIYDSVGQVFMEPPVQ